MAGRTCSARCGTSGAEHSGDVQATTEPHGILTLTFPSVGAALVWAASLTARLTGVGAEEGAGSPVLTTDVLDVMARASDLCVPVRDTAQGGGNSGEDGYALALTFPGVTAAGEGLPDWYDERSADPQLCPACRPCRARRHCQGGTSFCECDCGREPAREEAVYR